MKEPFLTPLVTGSNRMFEKEAPGVQEVFEQFIINQRVTKRTMQRQRQRPKGKQQKEEPGKCTFKPETPKD